MRLFESTYEKIISGIIAVVFFAVGYFLYQFGKEADRTYDMNTSGTVTNVEVERKSRTTGTGEHRRTTYYNEYDLIVDYEVRECHYNVKGSTECKTDVGDIVTVYYCSDEPAKSRCFDDGTSNIWIGIILMIVGGGLAVIDVISIVTGCAEDRKWKRGRR